MASPSVVPLDTHDFAIEPEIMVLEQISLVGKVIDLTAEFQYRQTYKANTAAKEALLKVPTPEFIISKVCVTVDETKFALDSTECGKFLTKSPLVHGLLDDENLIQSEHCIYFLLGNIPEGQLVTVEISVITELSVNGRYATLLVPTLLADVHYKSEVKEPIPMVCTLSASISILATFSPIVGATSPSHNMVTVLSDKTAQMSTAISTVAASPLDISLQIEYEKPIEDYMPIVTIESSNQFEGDKYAAMVVCPQEFNKENLVTTFVVAVDTSDYEDFTRSESIVLHLLDKLEANHPVCFQHNIPLTIRIAK